MSDHISNWISKYRIIRGGIKRYNHVTRGSTYRMLLYWTATYKSGQHHWQKLNGLSKVNREMLMQPEVFTDHYGTILHNGNKWAEVDHVRNRWITGQWCIPLTNTRQPTDNDNECQGAPVQSDKCEWMSWSRTLERIYQSGGNDESPLSIAKSLPLMTANPKVLTKRLYILVPEQWVGIDGKISAGRKALGHPTLV